jgi:GT2 family glycosyltransferase
MPRVAIIYVCYRTAQYVRDVAEAIACLDYPKEQMTFFLLPGGSDDGIQEIIVNEILPRSEKDLPKTLLLDTGVKAGFGTNNNVGMRRALDDGYDYVFLHNGDLRLDKNTLAGLVEAMEKDRAIASAQPLICYWHDPEKINVSGGEVHIAGYGFARDNMVPTEQRMFAPLEPVAYASGAAVLYRSSVLRELGLLEDRFFMYHEDLELGLRFLIAGYSNVLVSSVRAFHDYHFSHNPKKFGWMETYRWLVILAYLRIPTLILYAPLLFCVELGTWFMAWRGGWLSAKVDAYRELCTVRSWTLLRDMRSRARRARKISDRQLLSFWTGKIEGQEVQGEIMTKIIHPTVDALFRLFRGVIFW